MSKGRVANQIAESEKGNLLKKYLDTVQSTDSSTNMHVKKNHTMTLQQKWSQLSSMDWVNTCFSTKLWKNNLGKKKKKRLRIDWEVMEHIGLTLIPKNVKHRVKQNKTERDY